MTDAEKWQYARITEKHALNHLSKINPMSGQVSHSQAQATLVWFCRKAGFTDLASKFENLSDERGWTFTEVE